LAVGVVLLGLAALGGFLLASRPGPNRLDATTYLFSNVSKSTAKELVKLGSAEVLVAGVVVILFVGLFTDWVRAIACAVAPLAAVFVVEHIAKPAVGRHIALDEFTYPSGTVTVTAALAVAAFLVTPGLFRILVALVGVAAVIGVSVGVLALRWHYPTDVVGAICVGAGAVFFIDAVAHLPWVLRSPGTTRASPAVARPSSRVLSG